MMAIFNFFGSILGYLLWFLYNIFHNYGVAIIFFTIIIKAVLFPFSVKSQRSMASQTKLADKQKELQAKYGNNKQKYNEELMKLYEKEGVNPSSGCLTTLLPLPIMLGIYYSVIMPLSNTLHIASERIAEATDFINRIPGMVASATSGGIYSEMEIIRNFDALKDHLTMFTPEDLDKIESFTQGFHFLGLDLLATPQSGGFLDFLWIIPALSLISSFGYQMYMSHYQKVHNGQTQPGCMKAMMYFLPLISVYWAWIMPSAVGLYWVISSVTSFLQSLITNKYFSIDHMIARGEAQRAVTLELAEAKARPLPAATQKEIAEKLAAALIRAGWLDENEDGELEIHDWYEYAGKLIDQRQAEKERSRSRRAAAAASADASPDDPTPTAGRPANSRKKAGGRVDQSRVDKSTDGTTPPSPSDEGSDGGTKSLVEARFLEFWKAYPKKTGKQYALKAWNKIKPTAELHERIMQAVDAQKRSDQWRRENGRYIPNPSTWLNGGYWDNEEVNEGAENQRDPEQPDGSGRDWGKGFKPADDDGDQ